MNVLSFHCLASIADPWSQLDKSPVHVDVGTRDGGALYLKDSKIELGTIGMEMGNQFEVFGFAEEEG